MNEGPAHSLRLYQVSRRGGELLCEVEGDRVVLCGAELTVLVGTMSSAV